MSEVAQSSLESFVKTRLTALSGADFERFDAATHLLDPKASATDPACSLRGLRDTLIGLRAAALARIDPQFGDFPNVEAFRDLLKTSEEKKTNDIAARKAAVKEYARAERSDRDFQRLHASREWEKAYLLDMYEERIVKLGGKPLLENFDYYESPTTLKGIIRYVFGDHNFRAMRAEMNYLGHKRGSRDLYDHLAAYRKARTDASAAHETTKANAEAMKAQAQQSAEHFQAVQRYNSPDLLSDQEIVGRLQTRVLTYCDKQPDFIGHLAHVFGDALPAGLVPTTPDTIVPPPRPGTIPAPAVVDAAAHQLTA